MRYIFVSDIHGAFDKLMDALKSVNFNKEQDTIVSVGDAFDRGLQSKEVLFFLMNCPHRIIIWGNHDLRLKELLLGHMPDNCDYSNGVPNTLTSFIGQTYSTIGVGLAVLQSDDRCKETYAMLWKYFREAVYAVEWEDLIVTHAWIPTNRTWRDKIKGKTKPVYRSDWRLANREAWQTATWSYVPEMIDYIHPDKNILIGHWGADILNEMFFGFKNNYDTFAAEIHHNSIKYNIYGIDGTTCLPEGKVNIFVYENNVEPIYYY